MTRRAKSRITVTLMTSGARFSSFLVSDLPRGHIRELKKRLREQEALKDAIMIYQRSQSQLNIDPWRCSRGIEAEKLHNKIIRLIRSFFGETHSIHRGRWHEPDGFDAPAY